MLKPLHLSQRNKFYFLVLALVVCASTFAFRANAASVSNTRIFYFRDTEAGRQSLYDHYKYIDILAPQIYAINENGEIENDLQHGDVITFALSHGVKVMPLVTNKGFGQSSLAVLDNPDLQKKAIDALVLEAKKMGYIGFEMDFEQMDFSYKDKYSAFVSSLHQRFAAEGLLLSVAVISKISDNPSDYKNDLWQNLIGSYDYSALGQASDFVAVMSYDDPDSKGPLARKEWLAKVLLYSLAHVPKEKLSLGVGLYYWAWDNESTKLVSIGGYEGMKNVLEKYNPTYIYSSIQNAPYLTYTKKKRRYTMWYENSKSVAAKISLANKYGIKRVSFWALGLEAPSVFKAL